MLGLGIANVEMIVIFFPSVMQLGSSGVSKDHTELTREGGSYLCSWVPASRLVSLGGE